MSLGCHGSTLNGSGDTYQSSVLVTLSQFLLSLSGLGLNILKGPNRNDNLEWQGCQKSVKNISFIGMKRLK